MSFTCRSPLDSWFASTGALARFRRRALGRRAALLRPRDRQWRTIVPPFSRTLRLARAGVPFQIVLDRRYDRSGDPRRLPRALAAGATIYFPQIHQVLPRVMRLMVALRAGLLGAFRDECSFLFAVQGRGRRGMGLHHDGDVDSFWLQLEGRRTVTVGPAVPPGRRQDLSPPPPGAAGWRTFELPPGSLLYLPPRTPHDVVCHARSLALSLTWSRPRRGAPRAGPAVAASLVRWDVVSGVATPRPRPDRHRLYTQVPAVAGALERGRLGVWIADGTIPLPAEARPLAARLACMPSMPPALARRAPALLTHGILAPEDLPLAILPDVPRSLDGWRFA